MIRTTIAAAVLLAATVAHAAPQCRFDVPDPRIGTMIDEAITSVSPGDFVSVETVPLGDGSGITATLRINGREVLGSKKTFKRCSQRDLKIRYVEAKTVYPQCRVGEIPDPACSPGVVASTDQRDVCRRVGGQTYSQRHRMTPEGLKQAVRRRYGQENNRGDAEIDHRLPLSLGGEDSAYNLFWQPGDGQGYTWTYHHKDRLEVYLWRAVCRTHTMPLAAAQAVLLAPDWRIGYCRYIGGPPCK